MAFPVQQRDADALAKHIESLPQELYDATFDLVFTPQPITVDVDRHYKPPAQLSVDRQSREMFAARHYGPWEGFHFAADSPDLVCIWLLALEPAHRDLIQIVDLDSEFDTWASSTMNEEALARVQGTLRRNGVVMREGLLQIDYFRDCEGPNSQELAAGRSQRVMEDEGDTLEEYDGWGVRVGRKSTRSGAKNIKATKDR